MNAKEQKTSRPDMDPYDPQCCGATQLNFELDLVDLQADSRPIALAVTQDAKAVYVVNTNNTVSVIDVASLSVIANPSTGSNPMGIAMDPGNRAYVANFGDRTVSVFNTTTHNPIGRSYPGSIWCHHHFSSVAGRVERWEPIVR